MGIKVAEVTGAHTDAGGWAVSDDEYPAIVVVFRLLEDDEGGGALYTSEVEIRSLDSYQRPLDVAKIRDLPLGRWERAALSAASSAARNEPADYLEGISAASLPAEQRDRLAADLVNDLYPGLEADRSPAGRRRLSGLLRLAQVGLDYRDLMREGRSDPAAEIARMNSVSPATARSWVHRARKAGFLGQAKGRSAGEQLDLRQEQELSQNRKVARLYAQAVTWGSRSPISDVAQSLDISKAQASRLVRRAREAGLLPPVGEPVGDPTHKRMLDSWALLSSTLKANEEALATASNDEDHAEFASRVEDFRGRLARVEADWRAYRQELRRRGLEPTPLPAEVAHLDID